jgi:hypothetical protein
MNTQTTSPEYLLLGRGTHWDKGLSPEEIQKIMSRANAWFDRLTSQGKAKAGQPLAHEGKIVSGKNGRIVTDGPFAESKEAVAGYILLQVGDLNEAVEIAKEWPLLETHGASIEVRPVNQSLRYQKKSKGVA